MDFSNESMIFLHNATLFASYRHTLNGHKLYNCILFRLQQAHEIDFSKDYVMVEELENICWKKLTKKQLNTYFEELKNTEMRLAAEHIEKEDIERGLKSIYFISSYSLGQGNVVITFPKDSLPYLTKPSQQGNPFAAIFGM